jgi:RNA polymerase sigma factor (sigma-70 family)
MEYVGIEPVTSGGTAVTGARDFAGFFASCWPDVSAYCGVLTRNREVGDELAQEAFTRLYARWWIVDEPRPYVFRIASNLARRHLRESSRRGGDDSDADGSGVRKPVNDEFEASELLDAVSRLPKRMREVVLMHYYLDIPLAEVALSLRRPVGSVKRQLHEARKALGQALGDGRE